MARATGALLSAAPALGLRESLRAQSKSRVSVSYTLPALLIVSRAGFQTQLRALIFPVLVPRAGMFNVELKSLAPLREPPSFDSLFLFRFPSPLLGMFFPLIYLITEELFYMCSLGVSMGESELSFPTLF